MLKNARGNAIIEIVPILAVFILLVNFSLGFFGLIHSGIHNSIGARNYAFETFRNRADLTYLRDNLSDADFTYRKAGLRFHVIRSESADKPRNFVATRRPIQFSEVRGIADEKGTAEHFRYPGIVEGQRATDAGVDEGTNNAWIKSAYGICLNGKCGGG